MPEAKRAFYQFHASLMEPWDGPASIAFTDGTVIGAVLDRKGRLQPGRMFLVDTAQGRIVEDDEIKAVLAAEHPYGEWLHAGLVHVGDLPEREHVVYGHESVMR